MEKRIKIGLGSKSWAETLSDGGGRGKAAGKDGGMGQKYISAAAVNPWGNMDK
jgi:hypothetical protein